MSEGKRMSGAYRYMTDEELETLIAGVEDHGMLAPPAYLKELIMEEAARTVKTVRKNGMPPQKARRLLMVYRAKIIGAAAAAIFCLMVVPMEMDGGRLEDREQWRKKVIEEDMARYQEESERMQNELEDGEQWRKKVIEEDMARYQEESERMQNELGKEREGLAVSIWNGMTGLFGREETDYE